MCYILHRLHTCTHPSQENDIRSCSIAEETGRICPDPVIITKPYFPKSLCEACTEQNEIRKWEAVHRRLIRREKIRRWIVRWRLKKLLKTTVGYRSLSWWAWNNKVSEKPLEGWEAREGEFMIEKENSSFIPIIEIPYMNVTVSLSVDPQHPHSPWN